ncbi:lipoprotein-releasing system permease protein [Natronocella acetinitrilica]|jgi:lipoprotein-releasing system permease protein|uniref:Lipoprotein-releasing system permease protein n=1 Tax=Natronocella acetinitrilica TaxID=414046 RepID=A0AAE3G5Q1_9GAMM|nr:lipoprotein-releasing ABC transporter permease subunit [Natronocella acetinitrilica]MCP1676275.1 lipoprotein-releasing system permease protein [Natronocella acetinitrilica]
MYKPLELFIGLRYTGAKRRNRFVSFISLISMAGIALGVMALITVLSVMNGFERELRERILGMVAHASIQGASEPLSDWRDLREQVLDHPRVEGAAPFVSGEVMVTRGGEVSGAMIRGILPEHEATVSRVLDNVQGDAAERLESGEYRIILGSALARMLNARVGDRITVVTPEARATVAGIVPRVRRFEVAGTFHVGMYEYDRGLALMHLDDAAAIMRLDEGITGLRLEFDDMMAAPWLARELALTLDGRYSVRDWTREHANFFRAVQTEKTVMFVILTLIITVAAFNIVSTLVMVVNEKRSDIAILRTLGASPGSIMRIFMIQGAIIGIFGTLLGTVAGIALALNVETLVPAIESMLGQQFLPADVYYISDLPSDLQMRDVLRISGVALVLSLVATLYPAWRASRTEPAEALRYE